MLVSLIFCGNKGYVIVWSLHLFCLFPYSMANFEQIRQTYLKTLNSYRFRWSGRKPL